MDLLPAHLLVDVGRERRAASLAYCGSSTMRPAAVWIESWSSSRVVAPSKRPLIVLVAIRSESTSERPTQQRPTARTILSTSTARTRRCACGPACVGLRASRSTLAAHDLDRRRHRHGLLLAVVTVGPRREQSRSSARLGAVPSEPSNRPSAPAGGESTAGWVGSRGAPPHLYEESWAPAGPPPPARLSGRTGDGFLPASDAGRSSGFASASRSPGVPGPTASQPGGQCSSWGSFSLTAAGQPRILTEFPLSQGNRPSTSTRSNIL